jgi:hypothetical protein
MNCSKPLSLISHYGHYKKIITNNTFSIYACPNKDACLLGNSCKKGYSGPLCMSCNSTVESKTFYVRSGIVDCVGCKYSPLLICLNFILIVLLPIGIIFYLRYTYHKHKSNKVLYIF